MFYFQPKTYFSIFFSFKELKNIKSSQNRDNGLDIITSSIRGGGGGGHFSICKYIILLIIFVEEQTNL